MNIFRPREIFIDSILYTNSLRKGIPYLSRGNMQKKGAIYIKAIPVPITFIKHLLRAKTYGTG